MSKTKRPSGPVMTARCCWCGSGFEFGRWQGASVWWCPTPSCSERQAAEALVCTVKGKPRLVYLPLPKQVEAHDAVNSGRYRRVLYGGAAGGTKSHWLRWYGYRRCLTVPRFTCLLLRRTFKDLERTHMRMAEGDAGLIGAEYGATKHEMRWPNGSLMEFGHCQDRQDALNYLSAEYDLILLDELVTFEEEMALLIMSRARTTKPDVKPLVVAGTNPGGPHSRWVVDRWLDKTVDPSRYPDYNPEDYAYIPATLDDNPYLDREYEASLGDLPPELREAYRYGRWDIFPGQYFPEFRAERHVKVLNIPADVPRFGGLDWGYAPDPGVMLWLTFLPDGKLYVNQELLFRRTLARQVGETVKQMTKAFGWTLQYIHADPSMWVADGSRGESIAETFYSNGTGSFLTKGISDRINGWQRLRHWLQNGPDGEPMLYVHPDCRYLIRTLPALVSDPRAGHTEDVDTTGDDHAADALRYAVMSRPMPISKVVEKPLTPDMAGFLLQEARRQPRDLPLGAYNVGWR